MKRPQQDDRNWLDALRGSGADSKEMQRIRRALLERSLFREKMSTCSDGEKDRLRQRLLKENLFGTSRRSSPRPWVAGWFGDGTRTPRLLGAGATLALIGILLFVRHQNPGPTGVYMPSEDPEILRGIDPQKLTRAFKDLPLAGHQFQIVDHPQSALADWSAALIEAGVVFTSNPSPLMTGMIEIHLRLTPEIESLTPPHALNQAPTEGEWIILLMPKRP